MTTFQGQVISTKNQQTATIIVRRRVRHPLYRKSVSKTKRYHVHDPIGVKVGDKVEFIPCPPKSKTKRWIISKLLSGEKSKGRPQPSKSKSEIKSKKTKTQDS